VHKFGESVRNMGMKQIVIYTRVSTDAQNHASQLVELRNYCVGRGWPIVEEIADTISGTKSSRKGLDRLMAMVRRDKVSVIVCYKLDRIGRSLSHIAGIIEELAKHEVALVIPSQLIDTTTTNPMAEMQLGILAVFAQLERSIIVERTRAGLAVARAKGVKFGRPATLGGHREHVTGLRARGFTIREIATQLDIPSSSVFKLLKAA
jgi:putative DNA-invertase from lambdoid prophage Rac